MGSSQFKILSSQHSKPNSILLNSNRKYKLQFSDLTLKYKINHSRWINFRINSNIKLHLLSHSSQWFSVSFLLSIKKPSKAIWKRYPKFYPKNRFRKLQLWCLLILCNSTNTIKLLKSSSSNQSNFLDQRVQHRFHLSKLQIIIKTLKMKAKASELESLMTLLCS